MSLRTSLESTIAEETIRVACAAFSKGTVFMQMRDALGPLNTNTQFAPLFSHTGQPADAVRGRIDWKYARPRDALFSVVSPPTGSRR